MSPHSVGEARPFFLSAINSSVFRVQVKTLLVVISPFGQFLPVASRRFSSLLVIRRAFLRGPSDSVTGFFGHFFLDFFCRFTPCYRSVFRFPELPFPSIQLRIHEERLLNSSLLWISNNRYRAGRNLARTSVMCREHQRCLGLATSTFSPLQGETTTNHRQDPCPVLVRGAELLLQFLIGNAVHGDPFLGNRHDDILGILPRHRR